MLDPTTLLHLLHAQHRYYTTELGNTHKQLAKQYEKLASFELDLIQRDEKKLSRQEKKRLQWSRSHSKAAVKAIESQQIWLHDYIRQCNDLIASYGGNEYGSPVTPWSPFSATDPLSPMSSLATPTWPTAPPTFFQPQYWDLSMLRETRQSSHSPSWSAGSAFYEHTAAPSLPQTHSFRDPFSGNNHQFGIIDTIRPQDPPSKKSSISEKDEVPDLIETASPAQAGAPASSHKRRYSENAIQLIESRLSIPKQSRHHRGSSAGASFVPHRTLSVHTAMG